ncbi:MAG TPA: glycosyltransferase family 2 protein [Acidimicrobiia bacterium]|nr:glycosyltransferase family 2 protein [Acidimicrobiia bacterium]
MTRDAPTVRVIVVNYNGGDMTLACLRAVAATEWPNDSLEIVLVDNASSDGVVDAVRAMDRVVTMRSESNLGFAGGANLGLRDLPPTTSYVALVNNDVTVPREWLAPLVDTLEADPDRGAACPKILLEDHYEALELHGDAVRVSLLDRRAVTVRVSGARVGGNDAFRRIRFADGFFGPEFAPGDPLPAQWASADATLLVPTVAGETVRELRLSAPRPGRVRLRVGATEQTADVGPTPRWVPLPAPQEGFDVINNVGSEVQPDGYVRDRGYLERDRGQYDTSEDVDVWCGAAVLLPAAYVRSVGVFDDRLFAYYEDVDLALRGRGQWRYVTVPASVVRHVHMATSASSAQRALYFNERNRLLVLRRHGTRAASAREVGRFTAITLSYLRRDVVARVIARRRPSWTVTATRLRALHDCLRIWSGLGRRRAWTPRWS